MSGIKTFLIGLLLIVSISAQSYRELLEGINKLIQDVEANQVFEMRFKIMIEEIFLENIIDNQLGILSRVVNTDND